MINTFHSSAFIFGILQCETTGSPPFTEPSYCRKLCIVGRKHGIQVIVFSPLQVRWSNYSVNAFTYDQGEWKKRWFSIPPLIYNRCTYNNKKQYLAIQTAISTLQKKAKVTLLGVNLGGKWDIYYTLHKESYLQPILPPSQLFHNCTDLAKQLDYYQGTLFLKPHAGSHGKSTLYIRRKYKENINGNLRSLHNSTTYLELWGRDRTNQIFHRLFPCTREGLTWISRFIGKRKFIVQPYLTLITSKGEPYDIRVLMQKNKTGRWELTGMAARIGRNNSITSNLSGGGYAVPVIPLLKNQFEEKQVERLHKQLLAYSHYIPLVLEAKYGRMNEIGLDFGIDCQAHLWLLEVNSKPGRSIFSHTKEHQAALKSVENPILYALHLLERHYRRINS